MVKPGGTGRPIPAISAKFAPLPPTIVLSRLRGSSFVAPPPNANTYAAMEMRRLLEPTNRKAGVRRA
jgi:hypothetical protein